MYIIIKDKSKIKGRSISEFAENMESIGWPSEFANEETRDRVKFVEKKERRPLTKGDAIKIVREISNRKTR